MSMESAALNEVIKVTITSDEDTDNNHTEIPNKKFKHSRNRKTTVSAAVLDTLEKQKPGTFRKHSNTTDEK